MDSLLPPDLDLDTDIEAAVAALDRPPGESKFTLPANLFRRRKAEDKRARRGIQKFIRPENAGSVIAHLPDPGERTHCLLRGDFVLCDLIPAILKVRGFCDHLRVATLGMSRQNSETEVHRGD